MSIKEVRGADVLLKIDGVAVAGQRDCNLSMNGDSIDTTTKTNAGWKTSLQGLKSWQMTMDCVNYIGDAAAGQKQLKQAFLNGTNIEVAMCFGTEEIYSGEASITSLEQDGPMDDVSTASLTLEGASALVAEFAPSLSSTSIDNTKKIVTMAFTTNIVSNVVDTAALKAAVTFASDGTTFSALGGSDTVAISGSNLVVTFNSALTGTTNKIKVATGTLKTSTGAVQSAPIVTPAISAA